MTTRTPKTRIRISDLYFIVRQININKNRGLGPVFDWLFFVWVGVELVVDVAEAFVGYVGVDLGGGNV